MLKLKKIDLLTENDKKKIDLLTENDKIHNKSEHGCCDHKT